MNRSLTQENHEAPSIASRGLRWARGLRAQPCWNCGWNEGARRNHRIEGSSYRRDNVIPLCPNCCQLVREGMLTESQFRLIWNMRHGKVPGVV